MLVVSGRCFHVAVTKFQDKFASLQQVNSTVAHNNNNNNNNNNIIHLYSAINTSYSWRFTILNLILTIK